MGTLQGSGRFVVVFGACFLLGYALLTTPWVKPGMIHFDRVLTRAAGMIIHLCGGHASTDGAILRHPITGLAVEMKQGCDGVNVTLLLCAAVLAFPASWPLRAKGLMAGCVAIQLVNLVRFISLFYLLQYSQTWFDFAHAYLWESLIMLDALAIFWLWVRIVSDPVAVRDAHA